MADPGFSREAIPALSVCESPIEGKFIQAIFDLFNSLGFVAEYLEPDDIWKISVRFDKPGHDFDFQLSIQSAPLGPNGYRLDVGFAGKWGDIEVKFCVELDGKEFHSSADRVAKDKKRDRFILSLGIPVIRFTGSEVWRDSRGVANEAIKICRDALNEKVNDAFGAWLEAKVSEKTNRESQALQ